MKEENASFQTPGTYWQECFSHVALFLQQLVNILGDYLERGKKDREHTHIVRHYTDNTINVFILLLIQIHPTKAVCVCVCLCVNK